MKNRISFYGNNVKEEGFFDTENSFLDVETRATFEVIRERSEAAEQLVDIDDDELLQLEFEDGFVRLMTLKQLTEEFPEVQTRSVSADEDHIRLPDFLEGYDTTRGPIKNLLKKLKIVSVNEKLTEFSAIALAAKIEDQLEPAEGLYVCDDPNHLTKIAGKLDTADPMLILLHGTASSTAGSFGGFVKDDEPSAAWKEIQKTYKKRIFAFEHRTLSKSPLANAVHLLKLLPENATVHLVSHSRGGLIGEILSRNQLDGKEPFSQEDIRVFELLDEEEELDRKDDIEHLKELNALLRERRIRVEKFVRVACPASGTTLASQRLDLYLTVILNLIGLIPGLKGNPIYTYVKSFLIAFVKKKADTKLLPGLEAMMPESPFIRVLNNRNNTINSELFIIAGDVKAHGIGRSIAVMLTDAFYRAQHDFVVNTISMLGGTPRKDTYYKFYSNKDVSHFNYFINKPSQNNIAAALGSTKLTNTGFKPLNQLLLEEFESGKVRGRLHYVAPGEKEEKDAPHVYVLPGIMGSKLRAEKHSVWVNPLRLATGQMERLDIEAEEVEAYALMGSAYRSLLRELGKRYNVIPFPFDWRHSIVDSAKVLAQDLEERMKKTQQPIRIMGHSMGGLVAHALYSGHKAVWDKFIGREGSRMIFLGSPIGGSHIIPAVFLREHKLFKILHSLDLKNSSAELLKIIRSYPGLLELLPMSGKNDYFKNLIWQKMAQGSKDFVQPLKEELQRASRLKVLFEKRPIDKKNVVYVAGKDRRTPCELDFDDGGKPFLWGTAEGDSCVTWATGIPKQLQDQTWYMDETHGNLCASKRHFPALIDLLENGFTNLLPNKPIKDRGDELKFVMPEDTPLTLNSEMALEHAILGIIPDLGIDTPEFKINLDVCHGDLGNARFPVAVGHHVGDPIVSAERVVDFYMKKALSRHHEVGLYPGTIGSSIVLLNEKDKFKGAIVLGLGVYGELNEGMLARSFSHACVDYAMSVLEQTRAEGRKKEKEKDRILGVSSLLIGSSYSGLSIRSTLRALLNGVVWANNSLKKMNGIEPPFIANLQIIEIFKDRAIHATHELIKISKEPSFIDYVEFEDPYVREVSGMRSRIPGEDKAEWWDRLKVEVPKDLHDRDNAPLKFTALTDRARAEEQIVSTQRALIDKLIESSVRSSTWEEETARTLFHLLIPNNFKDYATDNKNILMILDDQSAKYPWEILHYPNENNKASLATQIGLIRQLVTKEWEYEDKIVPVVEKSVLVVGNPKLDKESDFQSLPYARKEAKSVIEIFKNESYNIVDSIEENGVTVINKLFGNNYKIIHLAGHGDVNEEDPTLTGMVLSDGLFITPAEILKLPQTPEFVFINCCYLGKNEEDLSKIPSFHKLAANLGTQFIRKGVKAVVAAGWAVDDLAAQDFAENFYHRMFEGMTFGEAVKSARLHTYQRHKMTNTWGAYQCYGDPYYQMAKRKKGSTYRNWNFVDMAEAIIEFQNIANRSEPASSRDKDYLKNELKALIKSVPSKWLRKSILVEAIANCFYELDLYEDAHKYLVRLRYLADGMVSLDAMHKLANLQMKLILKEFGHSKGLNQEARSRIKDSEQIIENLLSFGKTDRRLSLKGGHYKRKSLIHRTLDPIKNDLALSSEAYREAHELVVNMEENYYSLINWLTIEKVYECYATNRRKQLKEARTKFESLKNLLKDSGKYSSSFWGRTYEGTLQIYLLLESPTLQEDNKRIKKVLKNYGANWSKGGSIRKAENILGQLYFLIRILERLLSLDSEEFKVRNKAKIGRLIRSYSSLKTQLEGIFYENG